MRNKDQILLESLYERILKENYYEHDDSPIAWESGDYRIVLNDPTGKNNNIATLLHREFVNGREYWARRGRLITDKATKKIDGKLINYAKVYVVDIEKAHRGKGLGKQLYRSLLENLPEDVVGIGSNTESRSNKKVIPKLYKKLNAKSYNDGMFELILK
jgi:GNAT superfamily N-acetyltransferase